MNDKFISWFNNYIDLQKALLSSIKAEQLHKIVRAIKAAISDSSKIYICGNGGSLSNAQHFVCDLSKGAGYKINTRISSIALGSNPSLFSAISNDLSYENVFIEELQYYDHLLDEASLFIGISVSGNSPNVVKAMKYANKFMMTTIAIVGNNGDNKMGKIADITIGLDSKHFGRVEDVTMTILHMAAYWFMENPKEC